MNILQFLRIFWARRATLLVAVITCVLGAYVVVLIVQPRYEATGRVMMNFVRPDPVTGEVKSEKTAGAYVDAQEELIKDYRVTGHVVDALGWLSDPNRIAAYNRRPKTDTRDFRRWLAQSVVDNMEIKVPGTTLELTYKAPTPLIARIGAEALRQGYMEESVAARREESARSAAFYSQQADAARQLADTAEATKAAFEKSSGIIMNGRDSDMDSERLAALAGQAGAPMINMAPQGMTPASLQLAQIDAQLADLSQRLGPNHPEMVELRNRRSLVAKVAAQEEAATRAAASGASGAAAIQRVLQEQKARVISQRDKVEHLRQLQSEVELRRDQYRSAAARAAQFSLQSASSDVGLTPIGVVVTPTKPTFPNKPLIMGGAFAAGLAMGLALSLLLELLNRRVRGVEDLNLTSEIHCLGVVEQPSNKSLQTLILHFLGVFRTSRAEVHA
jgi:succinoglycan biosynthesis transport protein ExoP